MAVIDVENLFERGAAWPPEQERPRFNRYRDNRALFEGRQEGVYRDWIRTIRSDLNASLEIYLNFQRRLSLLWADLLLGEPPGFAAGDPGSPEQTHLDRLVTENDLRNELYEVAIDVSRYGDGLIGARYDGSRAYVEARNPRFWIPVLDPLNGKRISAHVFGVVVPSGVQRILVAEIHEPGQITTRRYTMDEDGTVIRDLIDEQITRTGLDLILVSQASNVTTTDTALGQDDYADLDPIMQEIDIRLAQIAKILDKHSDPNMSGPESALEYDPDTGSYRFRGGGRFFPVGPGETPPQYVVWDGSLENAFRELESLTQWLYVISETSPAAFGQIQQGLAESGSALRRLMMAPLAHVNRLRTRITPAIENVLVAAAGLERMAGRPDSPGFDSVSIQWQDGLPRDETEVTTLVVQKKVAGLISTTQALRELYPDKDEDEIQALADEAAEQTPSAPAGPGERNAPIQIQTSIGEPTEREEEAEEAAEAAQPGI
jgi:hypothetical protein